MFCREKKRENKPTKRVWEWTLYGPTWRRGTFRQATWKTIGNNTEFFRPLSGLQVFPHFGECLIDKIFRLHYMLCPCFWVWCVCVRKHLGTRCYILRLRFDKNKIFEAGGTGPLWIPVPTKLFHNGGSTTWSVVCTCNSNLKLLTSCSTALFTSTPTQFDVRPIHVRFNFDQFRQLSVANPISFRSKFPTSILFELHFGDLRQFGLQLLPDEWLL